MRISFLLVLFLSFIYFAPTRAEECANLSHQKRIEQLDTVIDYIQIECQGFQKVFKKISTGEIFLEESITFGRQWQIEITDNEIEYTEKKMRVYWSSDRQRLFEDYVMDGHRRVVAKLAAFYTSRSENYFISEGKVIKAGHYYSRLEFRNESHQIKSTTTYNAYPLLTP